MLFSVPATVTPAITLSFGVLISHCKAAPGRDRSGVIYGPGYAFVLAAPPGWVLDTSIGASDGAKAVFYPQGSSWEGKTVMYAQVGLKDDPDYQTLPRILESVLSGMRAQSPKIVIRSHDALTTASGQRAIIKYASRTSDHSWEAVAFIDQRGFFTELVLTAKTETLFRASLPKFRRLVSSYNSMVGSVKMSRPAPPPMAP